MAPRPFRTVESSPSLPHPPRLAGVLCAALVAAGACNQPRFERLLDGGLTPGTDAGQLVPELSSLDAGGSPPPGPDGAVSPAGPFSLRVVIEGDGGGTVAATTGGMCAETCSATLPRGQSVTLMARPGPAASFGGWSGDCAGKAACTVVMDAPRSVTARFDLPEAVQWVRNVPRSGALMATAELVLVGGTATGTKMIGDRPFEGGPGGTPFLARLSPAGEVQDVKSYAAGSIGFGALAPAEGGQISAGGFTGGDGSAPRTAKLARLAIDGAVVSVVDRPNVELLWNFGSRFLVLTAGGGLEVFDGRGVAVPSTQVARPFAVADAVSFADGGWAAAGQFTGVLRLGDRSLTSTTGDWVAARWRGDRTVSWVQTSPADKGARIDRMATNPTGDLLLAGTFTGQLQLQSQLFLNRGTNALFIARLAGATGAIAWGNEIQAPQGITCTALAATADAVYLALAAPGEITVEGTTYRVPGLVVKYNASTGAHLRSVPLDGAALNLEPLPDALYVLGDRLWKLDR